MPVAEEIRVARAEESQIPLILSFIRKLAEYERLSHKVTVDEELLRKSLFGPQPAAEVAIAYWREEPAGFAVYFHDFSTFSGRTGIFLEDLFVEPALRGKGIGRSLMVYLSKLAEERGCTRLQWAVLDWNEPAKGFYRKLGAEPMGDWTVYRLDGAELKNLC
jgi:GNAT superfamily N-acetyltransferase